MTKPASPTSHLTVLSKPFDRNWTATTIGRHLRAFQAASVPQAALGPAIASATEVLAACAAFAAANRTADWVEEEQGFGIAVETFVLSIDDGAKPEDYAFFCVRALTTLANEVAAELGLIDLDAVLPRLRAVLWQFTVPYFASDLDLRPSVLAKLVQTLHDDVQQHEPERASASVHAVLTELATDISSESLVCDANFDPCAEPAYNPLAGIPTIVTVTVGVPFPTRDIEAALGRLRHRREVLRETSCTLPNQDLDRIEQRISELQASLEQFKRMNEEMKNVRETVVSRHVMQF